MEKRILFWLLLLGIFVTLLFIGKVRTITTQPTQDSKQEELVKVTRVIDGDTIEIESKRTIRYIGIDTPESVDSRREVQCFGKEAAKFNQNLVEGKQVRLEKDVSETDKFGRLLRYVYVNPSTSLDSELDSRSSGQVIFVNDYLVRQGYAYAASFPPDVKYQEQFRQAEKEARENNRGLWASCGKIKE